MAEENKNVTGAGSSTPNASIPVGTNAPGATIPPVGGNPTTPGPLDQPAKPADTKKKKTIEVDAETLEKVLGKLEKLEKDNEILKEVADKNRLTRVEEMRAQGKLVKKVSLNTYEGKVVIGWKKIKDDVYIDQQGRLHEDQVVGLVFQGETEVGKELDIRSFSRLLVKIPVEVLEEGKDKDGNTNFTVQTADGEEIKIDSKFVN